MNNAFDDVQKIGRTNAESMLRVWSSLGRTWQDIAMEMGEYSRRSLEDGTAAWQKLMGAKSLEQAFEIQASYARRSWEQFVQEANKIGGMYAGIAHEAMKPFEGTIGRSIERSIEPSMQGPGR